MTRRSALLLLWCAVSVSASGEPTGEIVVKITGIRNAKGNGGAALFRDAKGFPRKSELAWKTAPGPIVNGAAIIRFEQIPPGTYAIAGIHDENANGKCDSNFLGIPREGFGFSNNPHVGLVPPSFESAQFTLAAGEQKMLEIHLQYR